MGSRGSGKTGSWLSKKKPSWPLSGNSKSRAVRHSSGGPGGQHLGRTWLSPSWSDLPVLAPSLLFYSKPSPAAMETVSYQHREDWLVYLTNNVSRISRCQNSEVNGVNDGALPESRKQHQGRLSACPSPSWLPPGPPSP